MSAPQKLIVTTGANFRPGANLFPGAMGPGSNAFNELVMPFLVAYLGGTDAKKIVDADFLKITVETQTVAAGSPPNSTQTQIKESATLHGKLIYFTGVVYNGYRYELRLNQDAFVAADLFPRLKAAAPLAPVIETAPPPVQKVEPVAAPPPAPTPQAAKPAPQPARPVPIPPPRAIPPPTPKPAPAPVLVVEEPASTPAPTPVEAVVVAGPVPVAPEPTPIAEAPAPAVVELVIEEEKPAPAVAPVTESKPAMPVVGPPAKAARKSATARKTVAPDKKAASAKKNPAKKTAAVKKTVAKKPAQKKSPPSKTKSSSSQVTIVPDVDDVQRQTLYLEDLLAELTKLRSRYQAEAEETKRRIAKKHGQPIL